MNLPFRIDFSARKPLSQQATDGFRLAIKEGVYRDGEAALHNRVTDYTAHWLRLRNSWGLCATL